MYPPCTPLFWRSIHPSSRSDVPPLLHTYANVSDIADINYDTDNRMMTLTSVHMTLTLTCQCHVIFINDIFLMSLSSLS